MRIASPREFWAGLIYLCFGGGAVVLARSYAMGTATRMGPAYFPTALGYLLCLIGLIALIRSLRVQGPGLGIWAWRPVLVTIGATLLFAGTVRGLGLAVALPLYVLLTARASRQFRLWPVVIVAVVLTTFCCLVFVKGLNVPLPLLGPWLLGTGVSTL